VAAEYHVAAGAAHALDRVDPGEEVLERLGAFGTDLEDQAGVAGNGMDPSTSGRSAMASIDWVLP
jgi:hypothetical protein